MSEPNRNESERASIADQAAAWVLRCDRTLTAQEQDEFSEWLAADPRHGAEFARHRRQWKRIDLLAQWRPEHSPKPNPDLLAPPLRRRLRRVAFIPLGLAAMAAAIVVWFTITPRPSAPPSATGVVVSPPPGGHRVLEDGSIAELNRDTEIAVSFTPTERRVQLIRGEANFMVAKNPARPFIVTAGGVDVRAVGTAFNVRMGTDALEVLVTEGRVQVGSHLGEPNTGEPHPQLNDESVLAARQRAFVPLTAHGGPPQIATLTVGEVERVLAWQHLQMDFTAAPLRDIITEFNRRNVVQLVVADAELAKVRVSATFRSDDLDGFVHLLEAGFGVQAERRGNAEIILHKLR